MANIPPAGTPGTVCRLCLSDADDLHRIIGGEVADLREKIYDCTAIEIDDISGVPTLICEHCRSQIVICHQFVLQCRVADWKYKKLFVAQVRQDTGSDSQRKEARAADSGKHKQKPQNVPVKPKVHNAVQRLKNDDRVRRHSIDRQIHAKPAKRRPSDASGPGQITIKVEPPDSDLEDKDNRKKKCPDCGLLVIHLRRHMQCHSSLEHVCQICKKSYKKKTSLLHHINKHQGLKPFKCDQCDKSYSGTASLYQHKLTHKVKYYCVVCGSGFTHGSLLNKHMQNHCQSN